MSSTLTKRFPALLSGFSLFICFLLILLKVYVSISFIPDISGSEGSTILPIQRLLAGLPIYTDPQEIPFLISQYTPLYFTIVSAAAKILGVFPEEVHKIFIISRFISILITISGATIVYLFLYKRAKISKAAAVLAACFIYQILAQWFLTSSRPDSLLFFTTTIFVAIVHKATGEKDQENVWWIAATLIGVTAFFIKQNGAVLCISMGIYLISQHRWIQLLKLTGIGIVFFLLYLLVLPVPSLNSFFLNIVGGVSNSISWGWFYDWTLQRLLLPFAPLIALNLVGIIYSARNSEDRFLKFLSISSVTFFTFSTLIAFKIGSGVGYYQGYLVVSVTQTVIFFSKKYNRESVESDLLKLATALYFGIVAVHCLLFVFMRYTAIPLESFKSQYIEQYKVAQYLKIDLKLADDQHVYITESGGMDGNYLKHFLFRNTVAPFADIVFLGNRNRTFDYKQFDRLIRENKIKYVITHNNQQPQTILGHAFSGARKIRTIDSYSIYQNY